MNIRPYNFGDYPEVSSWWKAHDWPVLDPKMLSEEGLVVEGLCAGWLYKTNSCIALLEWVVGNPEADKMARSEALDLLITKAKKMAKDQGYTLLFTFTSHPALVTRMHEKHDFKITDTNMTNLVGGL